MPVMQVRFGPQHPVTGQMALTLYVDGDIVVRADPDVGYTHRSIEKIAENRTYIQVIPQLERLNIADASNVLLGYVEAVEELMAVEAPERAKYIRVIMAEMNRIASHLYWLCLISASAGLETMLMWPINDRELILDLFEMYTGARITHSFFVPGGVRRDLPQGFAELAFKNLDYFEWRLDVYWRMLYRSQTFMMRNINVGKLTAEEALKLGVVGPVLRGSGVAADVRKDEPYAAYDKLDFVVPTEKAGDAYARSLIRLREMEQSVSIIRQALKDIPEGPIQVPVPSTLPRGEVYGRTETARGEQGYYLVSDGKNQPYRLKISTGSFRNLLAVKYLGSDIPMADLPIILWSIDPWPLDVDR